jgi:Arc/MetJ-type ribon-helix-helix transcriptional regulator
VFDKSAEPSPPRGRGRRRPRIGPEDERIALRCNRRELDLLDAIVAAGEFRNRSDLMREALLLFLKARASPANAPIAALGPEGLVDVTVRLRPDEVDAFRAYAETVANGQSLPDVLALVLRRGELELKIMEHAKRTRLQVQEAAEARAAVRSLQASAEDLQRRGVVGR